MNGKGHDAMSPSTMELALAQEERHLFPTYARAPLRVVSGSGCLIRDDAGRTYLDLLGGIAVNALGHAHPAILGALRAAAAEEGPVLHCSNLYHHPFQGPLAERLAALFELPRVFFCNSGSEAVEAALKLARARSRRLKGRAANAVVALSGSFHGRTAFALSATGQDKYRAPFGRLVAQVGFVPPGDAEALRRAVTAQTAAVILEPVQGEGGVRPLDGSVLRAARAACDRHGALLIADEVQCGLGRTGAWSACRQAGVSPDLVTLAKPLAAGLPLGALLGRDELAEDFGPGTHGSTFGGGPLPCRLALAFLDTVEREGLLQAVLDRGRQLIEGLRTLQRHRASILEVRGRGLMVGVVLRRDVAPLIATLRAAGIIVGSAGDRVLRLLPPYVVSRQQIDRFLEVFDAALARGDAHPPARGLPMPPRALCAGGLP
jgi:acetylornithine/N-succinyldiaminopimelate aminotransferase